VARIFDIPQPRQLIRCSPVQWTFTPAILTPGVSGYGTASIVDTNSLYFGVTNHKLKHTGDMVFRVKANDPLNMFVGGISFYAGFVPQGANVCSLIQTNLDTGIFYGIKTGFNRINAANFQANPKWGQPSTSTQMVGVVDNDFTTTGVSFRIRVTNRFVIFNYGRATFPNLLFSTAFPAGTFRETSTGYIDTGVVTNVPPVSGKFRWSNSRVPVFETLIPVFAIKGNVTIEIVSITEGEPFDLKFPPLNSF